jgi:hypothetical protein
MKVEFGRVGIKGAKTFFRENGVIIPGRVLREGDLDVEVTTIFESLFADYLVLYASSADELQQMLDILFNQIVTMFEQEVSIAKTKVMVVRGKGRDAEELDTTKQYFVGGKLLGVVENLSI